MPYGAETETISLKICGFMNRFITPEISEMCMYRQHERRKLTDTTVYRQYGGGGKISRGAVTTSTIR